MTDQHTSPATVADGELVGRTGLCEDVWQSIPKYLHKPIQQAILSARQEGWNAAIEAAAQCVEKRSADLQARAVDTPRTTAAIRAIKYTSPAG